MSIGRKEVAGGALEKEMRVVSMGLCSHKNSQGCAMRYHIERPAI
jgi:hypothetical protein